jgi:hypothetical protein
MIINNKKILGTEQSVKTGSLGLFAATDDNFYVKRSDGTCVLIGQGSTSSIDGVHEYGSATGSIQPLLGNNESNGYFSSILNGEDNFIYTNGISDIATYSISATATPGEYYINNTTTSGDGEFPIFLVFINSVGNIDGIDILSGGYNFNVNDIVTISGSDIGSTEDLIITVGNIIDYKYSTILSGYQNISIGDGNIIVGGSNNSVSGNYFDGCMSFGNSIIGNGVNNITTGLINYIGSGFNNSIDGYLSVINNGQSNNTCGAINTISNGYSNTISNNYFGFIGSGFNNSITGNGSLVLIGQSNIVNSNNGSIINGTENIVSGERSTIIGGVCNIANGTLSLIGGGENNTSSAYFSTILNGYDNLEESVSGYISGFATVSFATYSIDAGIRLTQQSSSNGSGTQSFFVFEIDGGGFIKNIDIIDGGENYQVGEILTFNGDLFDGGSTPDDDIQIRVTEVKNGLGVILTGENNYNKGFSSTILNGNSNKVCSANSLVLNGVLNDIQNTSPFNIVGGLGNISYSCSLLNFVYGGGNQTEGVINSVIFGQNNTISNSNFSSILNGGGNQINSGSSGSVILNGNNNSISSSRSLILNGNSNTISSYFSIILNGYENVISSCFSTILNGNNNTVSGVYSAILGGVNNNITHDNSYILGSSISSLRNDTTHVNDLIITSLTASVGNFIRIDDDGLLTATQSGYTGTFSADGQTVTVENGLIITIV